MYTTYKGEVTRMKKSLCFYITLLFLTIQIVDAQQNPTVISPNPNYVQAFKEATQQINITECDFSSPLRFLENSEAVDVFDTQAIPLLNANTDYSFSEHYIQTVIIAIDRNKTNESINGWDDMLKSNLPINFSFGSNVAEKIWNSPENQHIIAAMASALYGSYDFNALSKDFRRIHTNNRFFTNDNTKPISVMYDSEAVALIKEGRNIEIIFPKEGTLSFTGGLLHKSNYNNHSSALDKALLDNGFRLPNGEAGEEYPPKEKYKTARKVENYTSYNKAIATASSIIRQQSFDVKKYGFANNQERTIAYIICVIVVIFYLISVFLRLSQKNIRNALIIICLLELFLATSQFMKAMNMGNPNLESFLWYAFYFPFVMVPTIFVYIAITTGKELMSKKQSIAYTGYFVFSFIPILFVASNNLHGKVFTIHDYYHTYFSYNWGYYVVMSWIYASITFALVTLIYKAFRSPRMWAFIFPISVGILTLLYTIGIVLRIPIARDFDVGYGTGIVILLFSEACIQSKLFPINTGYMALFSNSRLRMEIKDIYNNTVLSSNNYFNTTKNLELKQTNINGGTFLYYEDNSAFNKIKLELTRQNSLQENNNKILEKKGKIDADLIALSVQKKVYATIDTILERDTLKIYQLLEKMKEGKDPHTHIAQINMIACGIKRECILRINTLHKKNQVLDDFLNYIHEMSEFTKLIPLTITAQSNIVGYIPIQQALYMYEVFRSTIEHATNISCNSMLIQFYEKKNSTVFSIIANKDITESLHLEQLQKTASALNGTLIAKPWDDTVALLLSFPKQKVAPC